MGSSSSRLGTALGVAAAYAVVTAVMTWPFVNYGHFASASYGGDARLIIWTLAWDNHAVLHGLPLFSSNVFFPAPESLRYIYMDGRPAPNNDPQPWWFGYSRGWYEGDTLVVETTNFRGDEKAGWLDVNGSPYSDALKMTERFRRPTFGTLEIDVTIDDPKALTKPITVRVNQRIMVDQEMIEFICNENEKSTDHIPK